jgi:inorganic triphosphatase YgiF
MEIEAKFALPDRAVFQRLLQVEALAGFSLSRPRRKALHDQYLDTAGGALLRGGYACRVRLDGDGGRLLTLKALTPPQDAWHVREELEVRLQAGSNLEMGMWPAGAAADLAQQLSAGQPLALLFDLRQERYVRLAASAGNPAPVVELSIDVTRFSADPPMDLLGVEAELLPAGDLSDLQAIAGELQRGWKLRPEPQSKFERGLALARPELAAILPHHAREGSHANPG